MCHIGDRSAAFVNLMEDIVAEKVNNIPITGLAPSRVEIELRPLIDEAEFAHEADESGILKFRQQVVLELVCGPAIVCSASTREECSSERHTRGHHRIP